MYVPVISALQEEGYKVILGGSRKQRNALDALNAETGSECLNVAGELSIPGFAALLRTSLLLIAPDSGPLHLARSVNTPTVGLYWAPNLINWGPLSRGIHRALISWQMQCPLCGLVPNQPFPFEPQNECEHLVSFVRDITPEEVMNEAFEILHLIPKNSVT
jgi:ADP-heptose:LPS heptosyltransferase